MDTKKKHIYNDTINMYVSFVKRAGLWELIMMVIRHFAAPLILPRLKPRAIEFKGMKLDYFYHRYNITWVTERGIEVPIAMKYLSETAPANTLEVGNVLSHYFTPRHTVVDKFETGPNVIQEDILTYRPDKRYELIISISTFEHIGYEDDDPDPDKVVRAIQASQALLKPGGKLLLTVPIGYNSNLDAYLAKGKIIPDAEYYFEKSSKLEWKPSHKLEALSRKYCRPFPYANAILVAEFNAAP